MIYLITGAIALALFIWALQGVTRQLGEDFAVQYVLRQRDHLLGPIQRELALARKLADSPLLKSWARDEYRPELRAAALAELDSYRRHFADHSYFIALDSSKHFYFNDAADAYRGREQGHTLDPNQPSDSWYFASMAQITDFNLNVNYDTPLDIYKLWFNVIIRDGEEKLGIGGTGLELDRFIEAVLQRDRQGVHTMLLDQTGAIKAYHHRAYMDFNAVAKPEIEHSTLHRLLASPKEQTLLDERLEQLRYAQIPVAVLSLTVEGQPYLAAMVYLDEIRWFAIALVNTTDVYDIWRFAPFAALLVFSMLALAVAVTTLLNRMVLSPLARLHYFTRAVAAGDYGQLAHAETNNEIGDLTYAFNAMALTVRQHTEQLAQRIEERTRELQQAHQTIAIAHDQVLDSIEYARLIQQAMLPPDESLKQALNNYFLIWKPRDLVGGDFYYCRTDDRGWLLAVVDCTGHGVPGAFMTMAVNSVLNHITSAICANDPARILKEINIIIRTTLNQNDRGEAFDNGLDAGVCCRLWAEQRLRFAGARFDLFYQDAEKTSLAIIRGDGQSLGYRRSDPDRDFKNHWIDLPSERTFYLTSDGLLDQAGGTKGYGFGRRRFQETLQECNGQSLVTQHQIVEQALADWQGSYEQRDDMTIIGFQPAHGVK
ncbi:MAG: SpoIIE family protein phosphatase [Gammaproteobacteria bacterium]|nr:SpoIIE family protein phosphatase [Gammaproteobacteria bacterium]